MVVFTQTACDLQPKILSLPDSVGEFISDRYPALLADPNVNPEIYNSAATDYGVYASPDLYGTDSSSDYVMYASVDDYIVPPQLNDVAVVDADSGAEIIASQNVDADATSDVAQSVQGVAPSTDYLLVPMYGGQAVVPDVDVITVARGDTLYQLAKKYNTSVKDLATLNQLTEPYQLRVGQKLQVAGTVQKAPVAESDVLTVAKPVSGVRTATRVELTDVVVGAGDTLYSLSRQYSVPVNDLAVLNDLSAPFNLKVGQKIRVPNLAAVATVKTQSAQVVAAKTGNQKASVSATGPVAASKVDKVVPSKTSDVAAAKKTPAEQKVVKAEPVKKISSDPSKKLPTIGARSSSKFSWPV
ncbi:MAG: LysM peptidoglycan-binding domain-containing protein, partial [Alphaproteobacteria bacterium]|nr:LysM peptidoglycan-binding domain-containing protein [Alphaproteobacteria bacterium]